MPQTYRRAVIISAHPYMTLGVRSHQLTDSQCKRDSDTIYIFPKILIIIWIRIHCFTPDQMLIRRQADSLAGYKGFEARHIQWVRARLEEGVVIQIGAREFLFRQHRGFDNWFQRHHYSYYELVENSNTSNVSSYIDAPIIVRHARWEQIWWLIKIIDNTISVIFD